MRIATIASLGASAALGVGALLVAKLWLPSNHGPAKAAAAEVGTPVVVAAHAISYGAKLDAKDLALVRLPATAVPAGAYSSVEQVMAQDKGGAPVALMTMAAKEPILKIKLSGSGARPTLAAQIGDGMRAYTIGVSDVTGGGGHILPGDRVDIVLTRDISNQLPAGSSSGPRFVTDVVLQNVRVLGMDLNDDPNSTKAAVAHTATLEVDVRDAGKLALAAQSGNLTLALRGTGAVAVEPVGPILASDLSPLTRALAVAQARPARVPGPPRPPRESGNSIIVVHGDKPASVNVPSERGGA